MKDIESKLSSKQKGEISENRVAEIITLGSAGRLGNDLDEPRPPIIL